MGRITPKLIFCVTEDWYFCSHRLPIAKAARDEGFDVVVITREDADGERIRGEGFRLIPLDFQRGRLRPLHDLGVLFRLGRIIRKERPALVHNVAMKPVFLGTIAARAAGADGIVNALAGLGYVFTSRSGRASVLRPLVKAAFRSLFRGKNMRVIVQNPVDRETLERSGVPAQNLISIAGSGVDPERFRPTPEPAGPPVVAMVSRMLWDKGVGDLVEAARRLKDPRPDLRVRLVGPPDPDNPSSIDETLLRTWAAEGIVDWSGPVADVSSVWSDAHIAVLPSYREGLPMSLLEAAACGRAIVATDVPGCREVVEHEHTGLLVPPRDPRALAEAIDWLAGDPAFRARLGQAARARVLDRFTVDEVMGATLDVYRDLCRGPRPAKTT